MADFIPDGDGPFDTYVENFYTYVNTHLAEFGLVAADLVPIATALAAWNGALAAQGPSEALFHSAVAAKVSAHDALEALIRALVKIIQAKGAVVTDMSKTAAGVPVVDTTKTPVPMPTSRPVANVVVSGPRSHTIRWVDELTPNLTAKPKGVQFCAIYLMIGTAPPTSASQLHQIASDSKTPYTYEFDLADVGKTAYYWVRWVNTKGEASPWGVMVSATITG